MRRIGALLLALMVLAFLVPPALSAQNITMTLLIKDEVGNTVAGAKVKIFDSTGAKVAEGTTNSTGYVTLSIPNETVTFWVELASGKYILNTTDMTTINTTVVKVITLDASAMYSAGIRANMSGITAEVSPSLNSKVEISLPCNATIYAKEIINVSYPKSKIVMPFVEIRLVEITVDGTSYKNVTAVTVDLSSASRTVIAGYQKYYTFTWTWETYVIIAFVALLFVMFLMALARGGRAIALKPRKYITVNHA